VIQPGLVDAARAQLSRDISLEPERLRQEAQLAAHFAIFEVALTAIVRAPLPDGLLIRYHQNGSGELLLAAGASGDVLDHAIPARLALGDQTPDAGQGDHEHNHQQSNGAQFAGQDPVHRLLPEPSESAPIERESRRNLWRSSG
jgi:hypothetical protein